jgi:hypothetical protein
MKKKYTDEQLIVAVKESSCLQEVLNKLNLIGGHARIKHKIINFNLNTDHWKCFTGTIPKKVTPLEDLLNEYRFISNLRTRLLNNNIFEYKCKICGISDWNGKFLGLQLDHISGDNRNNKLDNLRLLCANCHSQTDTYCGKKTKGIKRKKEEDLIRYPCMQCGILLERYGNKFKICSICRKNKYGGKLSEEQIQSIYNTYSKKEDTIINICSKHGISETTLYNLLDRKRDELNGVVYKRK